MKKEKEREVVVVVVCVCVGGEKARFVGGGVFYAIERANRELSRKQNG